jgi:hypothetical protein
MIAPGRSGVAGSRPEVDLLLDAARVRLEGEDAERLGDRLRDDLDWEELLRMAHRNAVRPLLCRSLKAIGPGRVPPGVLDRLQESFRDNAMHSLRLTVELLELLDLFARHGIAAIPYKGPTLAALAYGNVAFREYVDLDVLIREHDLPTARHLMIDRGYRPGHNLTPAQEAAYVRSTRELPLVRDEDLLVELHVGLTLRDYGFPLDLERLRERLAPVGLLGRDVATFSAEDLLLILCAHGGRHGWGSLGWICDLAELLRSRGGLRWDWLRDEARRLHAGRLLRLGLALAGELLGAPLPETVESWIRDDRMIPRLAATVRRWLFRTGDDLPGASGRALFQFRVRERWRDGARFCLSSALVPHVADWESLSLPDWLSFSYALVRPLRLAGKYGRRVVSGRK